MGKFTVNGGRPLVGSVRVSGSKNAALPIIFASIITRGVSRFYNLPDITDVSDALGIVGELGAKIWRDADVTYVDTRELKYRDLSLDRVRRIRASTYLIGSCLSRFKRAELLPFGGCGFAQRPIDMHLDAAEKFGAKTEGVNLSAERLHPAEISFRQPSVGATVNALILAAGIEGESRLIGAAREPHISALISYLNSAGATVSDVGDVITVVGGELRGGVAVIPGDMIEAGTYLAASIVTDGKVRVSGFDTRELAAFTSPLLSAGVIEQVSDGGVTLLGHPKRAMSVVTATYPGFATDLQPIFSTVLAISQGGSIRDEVWRSRFGYLSELSKLGVKYSQEDNCVHILPSRITPANLTATDLRGGAAAIILALAAKGISEIDCGELVLRGYDSLVEKLSILGADISYV